jgi:hypothetical protein
MQANAMIYLRGQVVKPTCKLLDFNEIDGRKTMFLAGSIEMGVAEEWQTKVEKVFEDYPIVIYNPRRNDWDASWEQKITNLKFYEQVNWELSAMEKSDIIAMYFAPDTKSPISLLEFGLNAYTGKLVVYCPEGFWRKGNIDVVAQKLGIPVHQNFDMWVQNLKIKLNLT